MGILSLLVMYVLTNLGALRYLFLSGVRRVPLWEIVFPIGGIAFAVYTLYKNLWPVPSSPYNVFPYIVAAWLLLGTGLTLFVPGFTQRIDEQLRGRTEEPAPDAALPAPASSG